MLSQAKIDLAILYKLHAFAEHDWEAPTPAHLAETFENFPLAVRRVEVALSELESKGYAESFADPDAGVYRWRITREGLGVVDRALRVPASFIARLATNGSSWLSSVDAQKAVLKKLSDADKPVEPDPPRGATLPTQMRSASVNWTKWGTILGGVGIVVTILIAVIS
ncbi:MAG: hypothetical protein EON59_06975 [Alphaproteobacteria bacterium]|nr:MAG: hypothetical protein EON59_06975 [Alphaproteobacteria bacterium]